MQRILQAMILLLGCLLAMVLLTGPAKAAELPDANCPDTATPGQASASSLDPPSYAQTFTALNSGLLTTAQMRVLKGAATEAWVLQISTVDGSGVPTYTVLASTTVPVSSATASGLVTGHFDTPASVTAGQQYALVLSRPGSNYIGVYFRSGDPCPGGSAYQTSGADTPFTSLGAGDDLIFAVFVTLPAPAPPDATPPQTTLGKHPKKKTTKSAAKFTFSSDEAGARFECKLDNKPFKPCTSPKKYSHLKPRKHLFQVASVDAVGNVDPSPSRFRWRVLP